MKAFILQLLHTLFIRRDDIFKVWKEIKEDGRISFNDFKKIHEFYKTSGFIPEENDVIVGGIQEVHPNQSKNLVQYDQSSNACAIYSRIRSVMYNVKNLTYSKDEIESIVSLAIEKGYLQISGSNAGMTFANADKVITEWTLKHKAIQLKYDKVTYGSELDLKREALGYGRTIGGGITSKYISDFTVDGIIDEGYTYKETIQYYHAFSDEPDGFLTDNYPTNFGNNNRYKNNIVQEFMNHGVFYTWAYYIFSEDEIIEDNIDEQKEHLFVDVDGTADYYDSIKWAKENGIVSGYSDGTLRPKETLQVDRFLGILHKYDKTK